LTRIFASFHSSNVQSVYENWCGKAIPIFFCGLYPNGRQGVISDELQSGFGRYRCEEKKFEGFKTRLAEDQESGENAKPRPEIYLSLVQSRMLLHSVYGESIYCERSCPMLFGLSAEHFALPTAWTTYI
jgi:hypothetical protein